jgi:hypothetical protein
MVKVYNSEVDIPKTFNAFKDLGLLIIEFFDL